VDTEVDAYVASAQSDFEAYTDVTFDETDAKHLLLLKMIIDKMLYNWWKLRAANAEGYTTQAGTTSRAHSYVFYDKQRFDKLVDQIAGGKSTGSTMVYYEPTW